jgi:hypothetical protein
VAFLRSVACAAVVIDSYWIMSMTPAVTMHVASKIGYFVSVVVVFVSWVGTAVACFFFVSAVAPAAVVVVVVVGGHVCHGSC